MKYMVLECHPGYAVVLDEDGNFQKVANFHYEVGQMLTEVEPMRTPPRKKSRHGPPGGDNFKHKRKVRFSLIFGVRIVGYLCPKCQGRKTSR